MLAALGWIGSVTLSASYCWPLRFLPPVALGVAGVLLTLWALRSATNPNRAWLDRSIENGHTIAGYDDFMGKVLGWQSWEKETFDGVKERFGLHIANEFRSAGAEAKMDSEYCDARLTAQIVFLEDFRERP